MSVAHKTFRVSVAAKIAIGFLEVLLGLFVLAVRPQDLADILNLLRSLAGSHVTINHLAGVVSAALIAGKFVTALYLLAHGIPKMLLGVALLKQKVWAYPLAMIILAGFVLFQVYLVGFRHSLLMLALAIGDGLIVWLVLKEYRAHKLQFKSIQEPPRKP